jgi:hypothetical protein
MFDFVLISPIWGGDARFGSQDRCQIAIPCSNSPHFLCPLLFTHRNNFHVPANVVKLLTKYI